MEHLVTWYSSKNLNMIYSWMSELKSSEQAKEEIMLSLKHSVLGNIIDPYLFHMTHAF